MRSRYIQYALGSLMLMLGLSMLFPLAVSLYLDGRGAAAIAFSAVATAGAGLLLRLLGRRPEGITYREGFAIVVGSWMLAGVTGALPYYLGGMFPSFLDAVFESVSGFTTTGATVLNSIEEQAPGLLFWRSFTQWLGGMGIIVLFVAVLPALGVGGAQLFRAEHPGPGDSRMAPRIAETARTLWLIYAAISAVQVLLLRGAGLSFFEALTHTFSTMATGGFSTRDDSVGAFGKPAVEMIIAFFMFLAGGNFALYFRAVQRDWRSAWADGEYRFYVLLVLSVTALLAVSLRLTAYDSFPVALRYASFQTLSILTTTGFSTTDFDSWSPLARAVLLLLMFAGGCGGSTAGAIKLIRVLVLWKHAVREVYRMVHPRAVIPVRIGGRPVPEEVVASILGFTVLYVALFLLATLVMTAYGWDLTSAASASAATLGNVGPGLADFGPSQNYASLPAPVKLLLMVNMILGRLEVYPLLVLFLPEFRPRGAGPHRSAGGGRTVPNWGHGVWGILRPGKQDFR